MGITGLAAAIALMAGLLAAGSGPALAVGETSTPTTQPTLTPTSTPCGGVAGAALCTLTPEPTSTSTTPVATATTTPVSSATALPSSTTAATVVLPSATTAAARVLPSTGSGGSGNGFTWAWIALGVLAAAGLAGGIALSTRRR